MRKFLNSSLFIVVLAVCLVLTLGYIDFMSGFEMSFFIFYIFPVAMAAWYLGLGAGLVISLLSVAVWLIADKATGHVYSAEWIQHWNAGTRLVFFVISTYLIATLKKRYDIEKNAARVDGLTGALNGRAFRERLEWQFALSSRTKSPMALAVIDLDNFKMINDTMGHAAGDQVLQNIASVILKNLRNTDSFGRMGGDEFALFFPATDEKGARAKLNDLLKELQNAMTQKGWAVGFSIGAVAINAGDKEIPNYQDALKSADVLMYDVKKGGKNAVKMGVL